MEEEKKRTRLNPDENDSDADVRTKKRKKRMNHCTRGKKIELVWVQDRMNVVCGVQTRMDRDGRYIQ
jgi:hypothetical protein